MKSLNPLESAFQSVVETRDLLNELILSSESFDYLKAKQTLKLIEKKARKLNKIQAKLAMQLAARQGLIQVVQFCPHQPSDPGS